MAQKNVIGYRKAFVLPMSLAISFIIFLFSLFLLKISGVLIDLREAMKKKVDLTVNLYSFINYLNYNLLTGTYDCKSVYFDSYRLFLDGREKKINWPYLKNVEITLKIRDGNSYLLSRGLTEPILNALVGEDGKTFIQSVLDWFDKDNVPRPYGAECDFYRSNNYSFCPRNSRAIQHKLELEDVNGSRVYKNIVKYISDYSENRINLNTADLKLIYSLSGIDISFIRNTSSCITWEQISNIPLKNREIFTIAPGRYLHIFACLRYKDNPYIKVCSSYVLDRSMKGGSVIKEFTIY